MVGLIVGLVSVSACAQNVFDKYLYDPEFVLQNAAAINLTDAQAEEIKQIYKDRHERFGQIQIELQAVVAQMDEALSQSQLSSSATDRTLERMLSLESDLKKIRFDLLKSVAATLTTEQRSQLYTMKPEGARNWSPEVTLDPMPDVKVRIRNTQANGTHPLFLIKTAQGHYEVPQNNMDFFDPNEIEMIEVIKGDRAISQFGDRATDGVVVVKLKNDDLLPSGLSLFQK